MILGLGTENSEKFVMIKDRYVANMEDVNGNKKYKNFSRFYFESGNIRREREKYSTNDRGIF